MAYTTINKSTDYFDIRTYSASGAGSISDVSFQPDFIWFKNRASVGDHGLFDAIRGVTKYLQSNNTSTGLTGNGSNDFTAFTSNGFTYGTSSQLDTSTGTPCTWLWKANGTGSANTDGTITSTVSANTTSGFSIAKYTGTSANASFGHGLGTTPAVYIIKRLAGANGTWLMYHQSLGIGYHLGLNNTTAQNANDATFANNTAPDTSKIYLGSWGDLNNNGSDFICYSFAEKQGYSKFGSYAGNGSTDGTFVYTGFKPAFVMRKSFSSGHNGNWLIHDTKRSPFNEAELQLSANATTAEETSTDYNEIDILSNGFKMRGTGTWSNGSGRSYIYMAFAEAPLVGTNNIPANAR